MHISKIIIPSKPLLGSDRQKVWKWSKMADIPYFKPFYSKNNDCIEVYSNLSQPVVYFVYGEMNLQGFKCILTKYWSFKTLPESYCKNGRKQPKMTDIPYFKPFYSKCKADVEGYSNLSQPMVYLKFREMNFLGLKGIF